MRGEEQTAVGRVEVRHHLLDLEHAEVARAHHFQRRSRSPLSRTPRFLSVSADPAIDEVAADAHLATLIPAAAATMAAGVEMLGS